VGGALQEDPYPPGSVVVDGREDLPTARVDRADLDNTRDPVPDLETVIGWLVGIVEYFDAAHSGQRHPQPAVDPLDLLERGELQYQLPALYAQFGHPGRLLVLVKALISVTEKAADAYGRAG